MGKVWRALSQIAELHNMPFGFSKFTIRKSGKVFTS